MSFVKKRKYIYKVLAETGDKIDFLAISGETKLSDNFQGTKFFSNFSFFPLHRGKRGSPTLPNRGQICPHFVPCLSPASRTDVRKSPVSFGYIEENGPGTTGDKFVPILSPFCPFCPQIIEHVFVWLKNGRTYVRFFAKVEGQRQILPKNDPKVGNLTPFSVFPNTCSLHFCPFFGLSQIPFFPLYREEQIVR